MVLVSQAQLFKQETIKVVVNDHVNKSIGGLKHAIEASFVFIIDRDGQFDFVCGLAPSSSNSTKKVDRFVLLRFMTPYWKGEGVRL